MRPKVLFCATLDVHFKAFHIPYLAWFSELNWEVHVASSGTMDLPYVDQKFDVPIQRSLFHTDHFKAYRVLKSMIDANDYQIVHCHTPLGGALTRLAARAARKKGTKVIYTVHGFHFCQDTPLVNWLVYYPIEKWLAHHTDCLITINQEDYDLAVRKRFAAKSIEWVNGVGVNSHQYKPANGAERMRLREQYRFAPNDILLFAAAEFNANKNQQHLIRVMAQIKAEAPNAKLLLAGDGPLLSKCRELAEQLGVTQRVLFLGYRDDLARILPMCDIAVSASRREGLPVNIMEAMACGLPIIATANRGHNELIADGVNGFTIPPQAVDRFAEQVLALYRSEALRRRMGEQSVARMQRYALSEVSEQLKRIYTRYGGGADHAQGQYHRAYI